MLGLLLSLSVGARPYYVLFIPLFLMAVCFTSYIQTKRLKFVIKHAFIFIIPCIVIGVFLSLYNYLRFDSVFDFGLKHQLNGCMIGTYVPNLRDCITGLVNNLFTLPQMSGYTVFSLVKAAGHSVGNEWIAGILWTSPVIIFLLSVPYFIKKSYKENKNSVILITVMFCAALISLIVTSFVGMVNRFFFEYLSIMMIISVAVYNFIFNGIKNKKEKTLINILFILMFFYSVFINISLLFSLPNAGYFVTSEKSMVDYINIINFLF